MDNNSVTKIVGDSFHMAVPLTKVDVENRRVSGWASLDNMDLHGDVILAEANRAAFKNFRGNIREQHTTLAVGKMVDFKEDTYYDVKTGQFYNGIYVTVYISKGAQDTWEKVLDETLTGFSIGGNITDSENKFMKDISATVRVIKEYELYELSLVDNPANQLANIFAITKTADGQTMKGMITEINAETVFFCEDDAVTKISTSESTDCPVCEKAMINIGWFESDASTDKTVKVKEVINKHINKSVDEGGVKDMGDEVKTEEVVATEPEVAVVEAEVVVTTEAEPEVQAVAEEAPVAADKSIEIMLSELRELISTEFNDNKTLVAKSIEDVTTEIKDVETRFAKSYEELDVQHKDLTTRFATLSESLDKVEKSLDSFQKGAAIKKSGDLGGSTEVIEKSLWHGAFLSTDDL